MLENIKFALQVIREAIINGRLSDLLRQQIFRKRVATPAEMDLSTIPSDGYTHLDSGYRFLELKQNELYKGIWSFAVPSRRAKALRNLNRGMRGFALVKDSTVIGDLWCVAPIEKGRPVTHPDLDMLGIRCGEGEAYAQDMLIDPQYRGKNLCVAIQRSLQLTLKKEGWGKVYGYYWDDNIPAMWMHRMLKYKELPKRQVSRFFFYKKAEKLVQPVPVALNMQKNPTNGDR